MDATQIGHAFAHAVATFPARGTMILAHDDADGLSSASLLSRSLTRAGRATETRLVGRGENVWSGAMRAELERRQPSALIVADLGLRAQVLCAGSPTMVIDHHTVADGIESGEVAPGVLGLTGFGLEPVPTTSLMAFWCAKGLQAAGLVDDVDDLLWLAAIGLIGDLGDGGAVFPEFGAAKARYGITALRDAVSLLNAARRSGSGDGSPALALLQKADGPKRVLSGELPETAILLAAKRELADAMAAARAIAPVVGREVAIIRLHSPCQIHPLIAQAWRGRLKDRIVMAVNTGFRPGWVHFAMRSDRNLDLVGFLRDRRPDGADEQYGNGHRQASGGALPVPVWNRFVRALGFGTEMQVDETRMAA